MEFIRTIKNYDQNTIQFKFYSILTKGGGRAITGISYKGGSQKDEAFRRLCKLLKETNGMLIVKKARDSGIHTEYVYEYVEKEQLTKLMPGIYVHPSSFPDTFYAFQSRFTKGIYSHETSLYLHDLTDTIFTEYVMTFPQGYNNQSLYYSEVKAKYVAKEIHSLGKTVLNSPYGNEIIVYNAERTLCDISKKRNHTDKDMFLKAIKRYMRSNKKDLRKLIEYSKILRVEKNLRPYIEILL